MIRAGVIAFGVLLTPSVARADWKYGVVPSIGLGQARGTIGMIGATGVVMRGPLFLGAHAGAETCAAYCSASTLSAQVGVVDDEGGYRLMAIGELGWRWLSQQRDEDTGGGSAEASLPFAGVHGGLALSTEPSKDGTAFVGALLAFFRHGLVTREKPAVGAYSPTDTITFDGASVGLNLSFWFETTRKKR